MAIEIEFYANLRNLLAGLKDGTVSFEDFEKAIDDAGDTSKDAGRTIEDSTGDAAESVDATTDAADNLGTALGDVGGIAKDALGGDLAGAADGALSSISGLAGAAGGIAGTAVVGITEIVKGVIGGMEATAEASRDRISDMYNDMAESRNTFLSEEFVVKALQEEIDTNYQRIAEVAKLTGLSEIEVARAMVAAGDERNAVLDTANEKYQEQLRLSADSTGYTDGEASAAGRLAAQYNGIVSELTGYNGEQDTAIDKANLFKAATSEAMDTSINKITDLQSAADAFRPIALSVDTSSADKTLRDFLGRPLTFDVKLRMLDRNGQAVD